jgi:hypothetical protein
MARRIAAVSTDYLLREVGKLDDAVQILPEQVVILTGLTRNMLRERMRTRPPQPPHPMPREGPLVAAGLGTAAAGAVGKAIDLAADFTLDIADEFFLSELIKGWTPRMFFDDMRKLNVSK